MALADPVNYSEWLFLTLVENTEEYAIFAMNRDGKIVHWNRGARHITGYDASEVLGESLDRIFTPEDCAADVPALELETAAKVGRAADERWHVRKDGSRFWALGLVVPIRDANGELLGYGKFLRDRTDLRQMQEQLHRQNEALRQHDEGRKRFLATLAHELRNPLSVLGNSTRLLRSQYRDQGGAHTELDRIDRQVQYMRRLVDDLADLAQAHRDKFRVDKQRLDLRSVAQQACEAVGNLMSDRRHVFNVILPDAPADMEGDPTRLHQVFVNLLTNAARYTPPGGRISFTLQMEGHEAVVRIEDSGIGISPLEISTIFELFTQAHADSADAQAGLGIGLALVREIVASHHGSVQARSEGAGKGSEFVVRLPLAARSP